MTSTSTYRLISSHPNIDWGILVTGCVTPAFPSATGEGHFVQYCTLCISYSVPPGIENVAKMTYLLNTKTEPGWTYPIRDLRTCAEFHPRHGLMGRQRGSGITAVNSMAGPLMWRCDLLMRGCLNTAPLGHWARTASLVPFPEYHIWTRGDFHVFIL